MERGYYYVTQRDQSRSILGVETRNVHERPEVFEAIVDQEVIDFLDRRPGSPS